MGFTGEMHGHWDAYWASLWVSGSSVGTVPSNIEAALQGTLDVAMKSGKARVKFQMKVVNGAFYLYIDSLDGSFEDTLLRSAWNLKTKTWVKIELPTDIEESPDFTWLDEMLQIESATVGNGTTYSLTFTRDAVRDILSQLRSADHSDWPEGWSAVPRTATILVKVGMDSNEHFTQASAQAEFASSMVTFNGNGKSWALSDMTVTAPKNSLSLEEWVGAFMSTVMGEDSDPEPWDDMSTIESGTTDEDWDDTGTDYYTVEPVSPEWMQDGDCRLDMDAIRHGLCIDFERTPRSR